jgi:hypothetical protein
MATVVQTDRIVATRSRTAVYLGMAVAFALLVFIGFAPSFYLRAQFGRPPPPSVLVYVHGILFTTWIVLLLLQTSLVAANRVRLHRRMGVAGVVLASLMVVVGSLAQIEHTQRAIADGTYVADHWNENYLFVIPLLAMVAFGTLVGAAVSLRRRPEAHKRLLICATIVLVFAAVGRIPGGLTFGPLGALALTDLLLIPLVCYDIVTRRRVHPATVWGGAAVLSLLAVASTPLILSAPVDRLIQWVAG